MTKYQKTPVVAKGETTQVRNTKSRTLKCLRIISNTHTTYYSQMGRKTYFFENTLSLLIHLNAFSLSPLWYITYHKQSIKAHEAFFSLGIVCHKFLWIPYKFTHKILDYNKKFVPFLLVTLDIKILPQVLAKYFVA